MKPVQFAPQPTDLFNVTIDNGPAPAFEQVPVRVVGEEITWGVDGKRMRIGDILEETADKLVIEAQPGSASSAQRATFIRYRTPADIKKTRLEDLKEGSTVRGVLPNENVTVVATKWHGDAVVTLTYRDSGGKVGERLVYRHDETTIRDCHPGPAVVLRRRRRTPPARFRGEANQPGASLRSVSRRHDEPGHPASASNHRGLRVVALSAAAAVPSC